MGLSYIISSLIISNPWVNYILAKEVNIRIITYMLLKLIKYYSKLLLLRLSLLLVVYGR